MGRLERNIERKKRRRIIIFSLLTILLLFLLGIRTTNRVMVQMTGLSPEHNILSKNSIVDMQIADIQMIIKEWIDRIQNVIERNGE
jgi:hypothetical protein